MFNLNPLNYPICFSIPQRITDITSWHEHIPFAMFLVEAVKPKTIVELGTHLGDSYCAFCQAVLQLKLDTRCYSIDTWKGDPQSGLYGSEVLADLREYHDPLYGSFSRLIQSTFDEALPHFQNETIDILHIDGYHIYQAVKHDFESWLPKVKLGGIVLFHDTNVRERDYGVSQYWEEIKANYPHFEFLNGNGLGVLAIGKMQSTVIQGLFDATQEQTELIRNLFFRLGSDVTKTVVIRIKNMELRKRENDLASRDSQINELNNTLRAKDSQINGLANALQSKDSKISDLVNSLKSKDSKIDDLANSLQSKDILIQTEEENFDVVINGALKDKDIQIIDLKSDLEEKNIQIDELGKSLLFKENQVNHLQILIQQSIALRLQAKYQRIVEKLLRQGTRRRYYYELELKGIRVILDEGWRSFFGKFSYWLGHNGPLRKRGHFKVKPELPAKPARKEKKNADTKIKTECNQKYINYLMENTINKSEEYVPISYPSIPETDIKLIAYYLPQYHPIPENDAWWGKGFTEWTNVSKAVPQFIGHYQPRLPGELGFYDLRIPEIQKRQAELARQYGLYGFCFHFYWFGGKTLLEKPILQFLENPEIDFHFCLSWANENWSRRWDGLDNDVLIGQNHSPEDDLEFIRYVSKYLKDKRYIRIGGKPFLAVFRPELLPDLRKTSERWRKWCRENGIGEIYLAFAHSFECMNPEEMGFDAAIEFAPNTFPLLEIKDRFEIVNEKYQGRILDYTSALAIANNYVKPPYMKFRGVCPGWDNEPRRPGKGTTLANSSPKAYGEWLKIVCNYTANNFKPEEKLIFVNAWNEWAEGAYLEPDKKYGYAYLSKTAEILSNHEKGVLNNPGGVQNLTNLEDRVIAKGQSNSELRNGRLPSVISTVNWNILFVSHDACRGGAQTALINIISWFKKHTQIGVKIICLEEGEWLSRFEELGETLVLSKLKKKDIPDEEVFSIIRGFCGTIPSLVFGNTVVSGKAYNLLSRFNTPIVTYFHELEMSIKQYAGDAIRDVIKYSDQYLACSKAVQKNLISKYGVDPSKVVVIHDSIIPNTSINILEDKEKRELRLKLKLEEDKFLVFGCGMGMPFRKGADLFIKVAQVLERNGDSNCHLYWIGEFDLKESDNQHGVWFNYMSAIKRDGLGKYVTFLGLKTNMKEYLQAGDVFLLTSREDPFPLAALEAAECGLPIICFADSGGIPDFVEQDAGFTVPYENIEEMAKKIETLMSNPSLRKKLGKQAREKMLSNFTVDSTAPKILTVCRSIVRQKPRVSIIVPNYNHEKYLVKRLDSIFSQSFKDFEVIILDDASSDNSLEVIEKYARYTDVHIVKNEQNSGSPFRQWLKGIDLAKADLIWVAESDDMSETQFIDSMLPAFQNPEVKIAYSNSNIIDENNNIIGDYLTTEYLSSLSRTKWNGDYEVSATEEINAGLGVKNTILNASSMIFKRFEIDLELRKTLENMRFAGDWFLIVNAIKGGKIHYVANKLNYHRRSPESVIGKMLSGKNLEKFYHEFYTVQQFVFNNYELDADFSRKFEEYMHKQWNDFFPGKPLQELNKYYPLDKMQNLLVISANKNGTPV
jgi:glycosyltransferase involved in cell wall biosynthesis